MYVPSEDEKESWQIQLKRSLEVLRVFFLNEKIGVES